MIPVTKDDIIKDAASRGYTVWANVDYEGMARNILDRLRNTWPKTDPSLGLMPDDTWVIWYNPSKL